MTGGLLLDIRRQWHSQHVGHGAHEEVVVATEVAAAGYGRGGRVVDGRAPEGWHRQVGEVGQGGEVVAVVFGIEAECGGDTFHPLPMDREVILDVDAARAGVEGVGGKVGQRPAVAFCREGAKGLTDLEVGAVDGQMAHGHEVAWSAEVGLFLHRHGDPSPPLGKVRSLPVGSVRPPTRANTQS